MTTTTIVLIFASFLAGVLGLGIGIWSFYDTRKKFHNTRNEFYNEYLERKNKK